MRRTDALIQMAAHGLFTQLMPGRRLVIAAIEGQRAALGETAAGKIAVERRHRAMRRIERRATPSAAGQRRKQLARIRMQRRTKEGRARPGLHHLTRVHDAHPVRHACRHAEIVGDQQHAHATLALDLRQQVQHLRLDGDVERRRRLIGDEQLRPPGERNGNHHALLHATRELKRIVAQALHRIRNADRLQQTAGFGLGLRSAQAVSCQSLDNLRAHRHHRIQAGRRFLEDHADAPTTHLTHGRLRQAQQILTVQPDLAALDASAVGQQARERERSHRLAATGFTQQRIGFTRGNAEIDTIDRAQLGVAPIEDNSKVGHAQQGRRRGHG